MSKSKKRLIGVLLIIFLVVMGCIAIPPTIDTLTAPKLSGLKHVATSHPYWFEAGTGQMTNYYTADGTETSILKTISQDLQKKGYVMQTANIKEPSFIGSFCGSGSTYKQFASSDLYVFQKKGEKEEFSVAFYVPVSPSDTPQHQIGCGRTYRTYTIGVAKFPSEAGFSVR